MVKRARRSAVPRRRLRRRSTRVPRGVPRGVSVFAMKMKTFYSNWTYDTLTTNGFWRYLTFVPNGASFVEHATVFDEYKINGIMIEMRPNYDNLNATDQVTVRPLGTLHYLIDPESNTVPSGTQTSANLNKFFENGNNLKSRKFDQVVKMYYKPKIAEQVFGGGVAGKLVRSPWLRTNDSAVEHRGVHVYLQPFNFSTTANPVSYDIFVTYYMQFRGNR